MHADNASMQRTPAIILGIAAIVAVAVIAFLLLSPQPEEPIASVEPTASPSPTLNADLLERRWTVLYVGTDLNERREAEGATLNTDALMLVSLSADQSRLTLVSLPRDTVDVPLEGGGVHDRKINGLYAERGIDALVGAMETLYGVPIEAHILMDMDDFAALVEAVDGVEVSPDEPLRDPIVDLDLEPGPQELDTSQTMGYVRTRVDKDYGRMGRQQEVLVELVGRLVDPETNLDLAALIDGLDSLDTDVPLDQLPTLIELARRATDAEVQTLVIQQPLITFEGDRNDGRGYILEPDVEAIRAEVQELIGD
jgi:LCP family protein required for cell wall assembly